MCLPTHGTYTSDDEVHKITISDTNSSNGQLSGNYESSSTPAGALNVSLNGFYAWVKSKEFGHPGLGPFVIRFWAFKRPDVSTYAVSESWNGVYKPDNTMVLSGSRAYVNEDGVMQGVTLGTKIFSM